MFTPDEIVWHPIGMMPLIAGLIDESLDDTHQHLATLTQARPKPHVLDDATLDRSERVHREQLEYVEIYTGYIARWRGEAPSAEQLRELDRIDGQVQTLRQVTLEVLALVVELRGGTIDRVMAMSDLELGLRALLGAGRPPRS